MKTPVPLNWQTGAKHDGHQCYVPIRCLNGSTTWGRIGGTQVTQGGVLPSRAVFVRSDLRKEPSNSLRKMCVLKRSMSATRLVKIKRLPHGRKLTAHEMELLQGEHRSLFYTKYQPCAGRDPGFRGGDIVLGANHKHYSPVDQMDKQEQNGKYKCQRPIPDRYMVGPYGNNVPWVAAPLSDSRSIGDWVLVYKRFHVQDDQEEDSMIVPDEVAIHRVGRYFLRV